MLAALARPRCAPLRPGLHHPRYTTSTTTPCTLLLLRCSAAAPVEYCRGFAGSISVEQLKELRKRTGADYTDCRKALQECSTLEQAIAWLKERGAAKAVKSGRVTAEGLVAVGVGQQGILLEVNSETDFVSRGDSFTKLVLGIARTVLAETTKNPRVLSIDDVKELQMEGDRFTVAQSIAEIANKLGESLQLRRIQQLPIAKPGDILATYMHRIQHQDESTGIVLGRIGALVSLRSDSKDTQGLTSLGKKLAMHIAGFSPRFISLGDVPQSLAAQLGPNVKDMVLLEQEYSFGEGNKTIKDLIKESEGLLGSKIEIISFARFEVGDGIEKQATDFAAEVQQIAGKAQ